MFAQPFVQAQTKENIMAPRHRPLWGEFTGHKGPVTLKMFPFDDVAMAWQVWNYSKTTFASTANYDGKIAIEKHRNEYPTISQIDVCSKHHVVKVTSDRQLFITKHCYQSHTTWRCRKPWWRHQMGTFSALLAICAANQSGGIFERAC